MTKKGNFKIPAGLFAFWVQPPGPAQPLAFQQIQVGLKWNGQFGFLGDLSDPCLLIKAISLV